jgi:SAM-dependent methyltransferase
MIENAKTRAGRSPAEVYEELFVPALFQQWVGAVTNAAEVEPGKSVLDVACGTGVLACAAAARVGATGFVVGLDPSEEMLAVARRKDSTIEWLVGHAETIPFPDESFDAVISQFGFMFFNDKHAALLEMMRVLRPGGHLAVAVCDRLENSPGYLAFSDVLRRLFGDSVTEAFRRPFVLGDAQRLLSLCAEAGIFDAKVTQYEGTVRFASVRSLVSTERACVWTLGGLLDDSQFTRLATEAEQALQPFVVADGSLAFSMPSLILTAAKPRVELPEC